MTIHMFNFLVAFIAAACTSSGVNTMTTKTNSCVLIPFVFLAFAGGFSRWILSQIMNNHTFPVSSVVLAPACVFVGPHATVTENNNCLLLLGERGSSFPFDAAFGSAFAA